MYCTKCGVQLQDDDRYCSQCGIRTAAGVAAAAAKPSRPLMLDKRNRKLAGVCAGFARYLEADVMLIRVIWLAVAFSTGVGFLAYIAAWLIMPSDRGVAVGSTATPDLQANLGRT